MKTLLLLLLLCAPAARAAIEVRLSVKFVELPDGTPPQPFTPDEGKADIGARAGFDAEVALGNNLMARTGRGYVLKVVEYFDIQPPPPSGEASDYWYNMNARRNSDVIERAAVLNAAAWRYNPAIINVYVNNSGSGQCCGGAIRRTISAGKDVVMGTVLHEVGHMLGLSHTHAGGSDNTCDGLAPPLSQHISDGDSLADTAPDRSCFGSEQLSMALFNRSYASLDAGQKRWADTALFNVMSYHTARDLTPDQLDLLTDTANVHQSIGFAVGGRTWWVDRNNTCTSGLPPLYASYQWWVGGNPLPGPSWGARLPASVSTDPALPTPPFGFPDSGPRPPSDVYPSDWPWPPVDLPRVTFCIGGPVKTVAEGITLAAPGDNVMVRPGTYNVGARLTGRVSLRSTRGTARLVR